MLHIIFLIFKILGMTLLILIGILLLILLLVLFIPVRYQLVVNHGEDLLTMRGRVHWLLHLIHVKIIKDDGKKLHITIWVLGIKIYDNLRINKSKSRKRTIRRKKKNSKVMLRKKDKPLLKNRDQKIDKTIVGNVTTEDADKTISIITNDTVLMDQKDVLDDSIINNTLNSQDKETFKKDETEYSGSDNKKDRLEYKLSFFEKIGFRIKKIKDRFIEFFSRIKNKIYHIIKTINDLRHKKDLIWEFLQNKINQEGFKITWSSLVKLCKHILPTKLKSRLFFGTGDPCTTGQALGAMGILYSIYGDNIKIIPDFENKRFEGVHEARGRISLVTLLIIVIKLILNKRFKELKRNVKILKEAL